MRYLRIDFAIISALRKHDTDTGWFITHNIEIDVMRMSHGRTCVVIIMIMVIGVSFRHTPARAHNVVSGNDIDIMELL